MPAPGTFANGPVLTSALRSDAAGGVSFLASKPAFSAYCTGTPAIPPGAWTAVGLDTEITDTWAGHAPLQHPANYYCQAPGWYVCDGYVPFAYTGGTQYAFGAAIGVNTISGLATDPGQQVFFSGGFDPGVSVTDLVQLSRAGPPGASGTDYVQLQAYTANGGTISLAGSAPDFPRLSVRWAATGSASSLGVPSVAAFPVPPAPVDATWLNANIRDPVGFLSNPPVFRYSYVPGSATLGTGAFPAPAAVTLNTASVDNYSAWDAGAGHWVVPEPGVYYVACQVAVANPTGTAADYAAGVTVSGATTWGNMATAGGAGVGPGTVATSVCARLRLSSGDTVAPAGFQSNVLPVTLLAGTRLVIAWESS